MSTNFISKINGLNDIGIENIRYDFNNEQLFVLYENSNIDILRGTEVINISDVKSGNNSNRDNRLFDIYFLDKQNAFIAAGFGIIQFDPESLIFGSTTITGIKVNQVSAYNGYIYACTEEGLYKISSASSVNLSDFGQWEYLDADSGLPPLSEVQASMEYDDIFFVALESKIFASMDGNHFELFYQFGDTDGVISFLGASGKGLLAGYKGTSASRVIELNKEGQVVFEETGCPAQVNFALEDDQGRIWYADDFNDIKYAENKDGACRRLNFNSPYFNGVSDISSSAELLLVASGGVSENFNYLFSREGFYFLKETKWNNFNEFLVPEIKDLDLLSIYRTQIHPLEPKIYLGSYWAGLAEYNYEENVFTLYNQENSSLRGTVGDEARERVTGVVFDESMNLWVSVFGAPRPLNVKTVNGDWYSFDIGINTSITDLTLDDYGVIWAPIYGSNGGLLVYDPGSTPQDASDDKHRVFNRSNSELTTNSINTVAIDRDGVVWVGTNEGPVIFDCGDEVFSASCKGLRKKVLQDSIVAFLLADQDITSIAFDGGNRKWFGTQNGIFVQSPDGVDAIQEFNKTNSPIFDNHILAMTYRAFNGEMVIGTNRGLLGYRTPTSIPEKRFSQASVKVFPNPVRPGYQGLIAISGLVDGARVKITDINGYLVYETNALGGTATWSGKDQDNSPVSSGIYLIFSSENGAFNVPDSYVTKVLVLR